MTAMIEEVFNQEEEKDMKGSKVLFMIPYQELYCKPQCQNL